jgi:hypothetical protein
MSGTNATVIVDFGEVKQYSNYPAFYTGITICTIIFGLLVILNAVCLCTRFRGYWRNKNTGNRIIGPVYLVTPRNTEPLVA